VSTLAARIPAAFARLSRRRDGALVAGVCSGLAREARVDPTVLRLIVAFLALADGAGAVAYAGAWLALPVEGEAQPPRARRVGGLVLLAVSAALAVRAAGVDDSVVWPAALVGAGVFLVFRHTGGDRRTFGAASVLGVALAVVGGVLFLQAAADGDQRGAFVPPASLLVVLALVLGPWIWRLAHERDAERVERIRAQERADMAARVHDSVLQTLALVQRSTDDPKRVAALARRQERELRAWLYGPGGTEEETLARTLEEALAEVEELHGVKVDIVQTGDRLVDERLSALVRAAREAVTNAAVHAGVSEVSVFVDVGDADVALYVRDRGAGFDRAAVAPDRHGIAESIERRVVRHGGTATIRTAPGEGTEVELRMPLEPPQEGA
jgi:signal transduction histidine kinase